MVGIGSKARPEIEKSDLYLFAVALLNWSDPDNAADPVSALINGNVQYYDRYSA